MSYSGNKLAHLLQITLLLLLLSMQNFVLAHELDRSVVHDGGLCAVCSIGSNHDGITAGHSECPVEADNSLLAPVFRDFPLSQASRHSPEARAPPCSR